MSGTTIAALHRLLVTLLMTAVAMTPSVALGEATPGTLADPQPGQPSPSVDRSPASPRAPLAAQEVLGFLPYWELGSAAAIDLDVLTTLAWFSLEAGPDGRLVRMTEEGGPTPGWAGWTSEAFDALLARAEAASVRVVLTVERFSWDAAGRKISKGLLGNEATRAVLVQDIVDTITARGVGGVNLDFEPLPRSVRSPFVRLVRELRSALDAVDPSLQLTYDLTADVTSYPVRRLTGTGAADAAVLMGYEYRTAGSRIAGSVAPLRDPDDLDLRDSVDLALSRVSPDHLILALPWYGRAWSTQSDEAGTRTRRSERFISPSTASYAVAVPRAASAGRRYDRVQASAWSAYRSRACHDCPLSWRQLWFDDADSVRAKVGFAVRKDLRGVGIWALGYEGARPELWSALRYALGEAEDDMPPSGTASIAAESVLGEHDGLPLVGPTVRLDLSAQDDSGGSGVALVRIATRGGVSDRGVLRTGTTFPAVESVAISMPDADPTEEIFIPGGGAPPTPSPNASPDHTPGSIANGDGTPTTEPSITTIHVQWRDIAGNWSEAVKLRAYHTPEAMPSSSTHP